MIPLDVPASIGAGTVNAYGDIDVVAPSLIDVDPFAISAGFGGFGFGGSVSLWNVGTSSFSAYTALDKNGNEVFRLEYDFIEGRIVALENEDTDFGKFLNVSIRDGGQVYRLRMERGSRYWADFLMRLPMLNLGEEVRLSPYSIKEEGKKTPNQGIAMKQAGEKIARKWNKENDYAGGPPQAEYDEDEGEWKFGKRNRWLEENVLDPARGTLAKLVSPTSSPAIAVANSSNPDDDDLPF